MREIKFRAWDNEKKVIINDFVVSGWLGQILCPGISGWTSMHCRDISEPMQFTGLKDKNNKEIYEGDCLGGIFGGPQYIGWCDKCASFNMMMHEIIKDYGPCMQCEGDVPWIDIAQEDINNLEVIGNIYENPELLNV